MSNDKCQMSNVKCQIKKYPLLPFSQLVYDIPCWWRQVYRFPFVYKWIEGIKERECIEQAVRAALLNHPVFSSMIDWRGRQYSITPKHILRGKYHRFSFCVEGSDLLITARLSRVLGDGKSMEILKEDILRAYKDESLERDDYWGFLEYVEQQKQSNHYRISHDWLINEFSDESIPVHPTLDRRLWTLLPPKAGLYKTDYSDLHDKINQLAETEFLSMDGFFSLCVALAIAEYCGTDAAALTWAYEGRERPEEQRIFGSLHRDIPFQIRNLKFEILNHKSNLIRQARNQIRSGIAHSDYPYTLTKPYTKRWNYAVNVLRVPDEEEVRKHLPASLELLPLPKQKFAYALLDVEIHELSDGLALWYRYSATHYKESSIHHFAALVRKYAEWLLEK